MEYTGRYKIFDTADVSTYPVAERANKVKVSDLVVPAEVMRNQYELAEQCNGIAELARDIVEAKRRSRGIIWFTGAHLIKNGLGTIVIDLLRRGLVTVLATNVAGIIHDFELALIGETSEDVPNALPDGKFGMAYELSYLNAALIEGNVRKLGYGEAVGRFICEDEFRRAVANRMGLSEPIVFRHADISIIANCYRLSIPLTVHAGIGTDVTDQHVNFDGSAKGGCSGRDFLIFTNEVSRLADGGVFLNIGSAVTGPEVLLKAVSMVSNVARPPKGLITADFDLREYRREAMTDESTAHYYYRDHKSVVTRIPDAFEGRGYYIQGDQRQTIPALYQHLVKLL